MSDLKQTTALERERTHSSSEEDYAAEKGSITKDVTANHAENLDDLDDPDAGKSPEERAAIVRRPSWTAAFVLANRRIGQEIDAQDRPLAYPMALLTISVKFP